MNEKNKIDLKKLDSKTLWQMYPFGEYNHPLYLDNPKDTDRPFYLYPADTIYYAFHKLTPVELKLYLAITRTSWGSLLGNISLLQYCKYR